MKPLDLLWVSLHKQLNWNTSA